MRIIAGKLKGHIYEAPKGHRTHPMGDKIKGGLFNSLGGINGKEVLDVFSGSGALAFEAISRGASYATCIESDIKAYKVIQKNIESLKIEEQVKVTKAYLKSWLNRMHNESYDLIFADPPYDEINKDVKALKRLEGLLKDNGVLILSWPGKAKLLQLEGLEVTKNNNYGDAQLVFYRKLQ